MADHDGVAVYWDFENIHAAVLEQEQGPGAYRRSVEAGRAQEPVVEIDAVVDYAASFGRVVINRAYGNWHAMHEYREQLLAQSIELVQLFPVSRLKNGADIRLSLDVLDDLTAHAGISHLIIVAGDSDFIPLAQRVRRLGRQVIGVSAERAAAHHWVTACDEFKFYRTLARRRSPGTTEVVDEVLDLRDDAGDLLVRAVTQLASASDADGWAKKAGVCQMLLRLDPRFDVEEMGYASLKEFLAAHDDLVEVRQGEYDHEMRVRREAVKARQDAEGVGAASGDPVASRYGRALKRTGVRLLSPDDFRLGLEQATRLPPGPVAKAEIDRYLGSAFVATGGEPDGEAMTKGRKLRHLLFVAGLPVVSRTGDVSFAVDTVAVGRTAIVRALVARLRNSTDSLDSEAVTHLLFGDAVTAEERQTVEAACRPGLPVATGKPSVPRSSAAPPT